MCVFVVGATLLYQWLNFSSIWVLAMKTLDSLLRIGISYKKWSWWMKVGCITTTRSPNGRVNTGSTRTSGNCGKYGSRNLQTRFNWSPFFTTEESFINIFASQKRKLIRIIIWKSCRFCVCTLLANDLTFGTPRSSTRTTRIHTLQGRLWSTSNRMVFDSCITYHTEWTWCLATTGFLRRWNRFYGVSSSRRCGKSSTRHTSSSILLHWLISQKRS